MEPEKSGFFLCGKASMLSVIKFIYKDCRKKGFYAYGAGDNCIR
jgi:hypothetical protein